MSEERRKQIAEEMTAAKSDFEKKMSELHAEAILIDYGVQVGATLKLREGADFLVKEIVSKHGKEPVIKGIVTKNIEMSAEQLWFEVEPSISED